MHLLVKGAGGVERGQLAFAENPLGIHAMHNNTLLVLAVASEKALGDTQHKRRSVHHPTLDAQREYKGVDDRKKPKISIHHNRLCVLRFSAVHVRTALYSFVFHFLHC